MPFSLLFIKESKVTAPNYLSPRQRNIYISFRNSYFLLPSLSISYFEASEITAPFRHVLDDPLLIALTEDEWDRRQNECNIDRQDGMNLGGCGMIRLEDTPALLVVVACNDMPMIRCPSHPHANLELKLMILMV